MEELSILDIFDQDVAEAMLRYTGIDENFEAFCRANEEDELSVLEWIYKFRLEKFDDYCRENYNFTIKERKRKSL